MITFKKNIPIRWKCKIITSSKKKIEISINTFARKNKFTIFSGNKSLHSHNTITDFNLEEGDKIDLSAFGISNAEEALERSTITINATFIEISESITITVEHVDLSSDLSWIA